MTDATRHLAVDRRLPVGTVCGGGPGRDRRGRRLAPLGQRKRRPRSLFDPTPPKATLLGGVFVANLRRKASTAGDPASLTDARLPPFVSGDPSETSPTPLAHFAGRYRFSAAVAARPERRYDPAMDR